MPAIFFGHGNPMNAIEVNGYTKAWSRLAETFPRPKAILSVSAHWYGAGTLLTAMDAPRTIHDFGGFPRGLLEFEYPAPGDPALAKRVRELLAPVPAGLDDRWGLDHGTWSVLCHLYPYADVPVVQLSIDEIEPASFHFELGRRLAPLREEGVLLIGSGNVVHNLHAYAWGRHPTEPFDWAVRFEQRVRGSLLASCRVQQKRRRLHPVLGWRPSTRYTTATRHPGIRGLSDPNPLQLHVLPMAHPGSCF